MKIATQKDWKTVEMPPHQATFSLNMELTELEFLLLKAGLIPEAMEDKWFIYYENSKFYFHRSWTGYCVYIVDSARNEDGGYLLTNVAVNQDKSQYTEEDMDRSRNLLKTLISMRIQQKVDTDLLKSLFEKP